MKINTSSFIGSPVLAAVFLSSCCSIGPFIQKPVASEEALGSTLKAQGTFIWVESMTSPRPAPVEPLHDPHAELWFPRLPSWGSPCPLESLTSSVHRGQPAFHPHPQTPTKRKKAGLGISPCQNPRRGHCRCLTAPILSVPLYRGLSGPSPKAQKGSTPAMVLS